MTATVPANILSGWRVLVVDDEPDAIEVVETLLMMYGANVLTARNGQEALDKIRQHRPRFVIADLSMPEMSGWQMIEILKNDRTTMDIPIVALTAHAMQGDRNKAMAKGFHNFLTKPLRPETFVNELLALLANDIPELAHILN